MSEVPTASSVYSQSSPEFDDHQTPIPRSPPRSSSIYPEDISPPDTPGTRGENTMTGRTSLDVSPISATPSPTTDRYAPLAASGSRRYNSNLPVPRSNTKKFWKLPNAAIGSQDPEASNVRWDEYSGEPTAGEKGKPPSATPGSVKLRETPSPLRLKPSYGTSTHISGGNVPARKRVGSREITEASIVERPEWRGAGGRHSIVKPVFDKPLPPGQSSKFPAGSHKKWLEEQERERAEHEQYEKLEKERAEREAFERAQEELEIAKQMRERAEQEQRERERERQQRMARDRIEKAKRERERIHQAQEDSERRARERVERVPPPAVPEPLRLASRTPSSTQTPTQAHFAPTPADILDAIEAKQQSTMHPTESGNSSESSTPSTQDPKTRVASLMNEDRRSPLARNPSHEELKTRRNHSLPSLPRSSQPSPQSPSIQGEPSPSVASSEFPARDSSLSDSSQIESKFRATLDHMAIYGQPQSRFSATTVATTADDNSPPQTPEMDSNVSSTTTTPNSILNRKRPVAPAGIVRRKPTPSDIAMGTPNGVTRKDSKSLPKPPPEAQLLDPVQGLRAKQDVLRRRRRNLETVIHELTNVVQPSSIAYDRASRAEIKKTVAGLEKELAEVVKDEHDTGLKLHRAWKRHDDFIDYEPTSFWVRRVTS